MEKIFVVTAFGIGMDTVARAFKSREDAIAYAWKLEEEYDMFDVTSVCKGIRKGISSNCQCEIEIQVHETELL